MSAWFCDGQKGDDWEADWWKIICSSVGERGVLTTASFTQLWEMGHWIAWQGWYEGGGRHGCLRVPLKGRKGQMQSACLVMYGREVSQGLLGYIDQALLRQHREEAPDPFTYTPMHVAASYSQIQVLSYLVSHGEHSLQGS